MEPTTSQTRSLDAPPGGVPPGRLLFSRRSSALWFLPAVLVHLAAVLLLLALPDRPTVVERPLPAWSLALTPPTGEPAPPDLPSPPAALRLPAFARAQPAPAAAATPSLVQPGVRAPAGL